MKTHQVFALTVFLFSGLLSAGAQASLVSVVGSSFTLEYDSQAVQLASIDELTVNQNSIKIQPTEYSVIATGPGADQQTLATSFSFKLLANSGYGFTSFDWLAQGDYILVNGFSAATVDAAGMVTIVDDSDATLSQSENLIFSDLTQAGFDIDWNAAALIGASEISTPTVLTEVLVTVDGSMSAGVEAGGIQAKMEMKFARLLVGIEPTSEIRAQQGLPTPPTVYLLLGGLAVGFLRFAGRAKV